MRRATCGIVVAAMGIALAMGCSDSSSNSDSSDQDKGSNADLSALSVSSGTLRPAFSPGTTAYALLVENGISSVTVKGAKADPKAAVSAPVTLGALAADAAQTATIKVKAEDGTTTKSYTVKVTRSLLTTIAVPAGTFRRDSTAGNTAAVSAFRAGDKEITRAQFSAIMGYDPTDTSVSSGTGDPVQMASWYHAIAFCNKLSAAEGLKPVYSVTGVDFSALAFADIPTVAAAAWDAAAADWSANGYRLPTNMEYMWAAMGATDAATGYTKGYAGSTEAGGAKVNIGDYVWYAANSGAKTHPVGSAGTTGHPNELRLYDMNGNVFEWCWDWDWEVNPTGALTDYRGPAYTGFRALRGGAYNSDAGSCTVAYSALSTPNSPSSNIGFRVVRP